jgi:hypothetical protein
MGHALQFLQIGDQVVPEQTDGPAFVSGRLGRTGQGYQVGFGATVQRAFAVAAGFARQDDFKSIFDEPLPYGFHGAAGDADGFGDFDVDPSLVCQEQRLSAFSFLGGVFSFAQQAVEGLDFFIGQGDAVAFGHVLPPV